MPAPPSPGPRRPVLVGAAVVAVIAAAVVALPHLTGPAKPGDSPPSPGPADPPRPAGKQRLMQELDEAARNPQPEQRPEIEPPYIPTPEKVVAEMLKLAAVKEGEVVYDLGCGDGRITIAAVRDFKAGKGLGIDFNPERVKDSRYAAGVAGPEVQKKVEFREGDVLKMTPEDFAGVDVVTLYMYLELNKRIRPVLWKGLKPGARVVAHDFHMGDDWPPEKTVRVEADRTHTLYLWTVRPTDGGAKP